MFTVDALQQRYNFLFDAAAIGIGSFLPASPSIRATRTSSFSTSLPVLVHIGCAMSIAAVRKGSRHQTCREQITDRMHAKIGHWMRPCLLYT